MNGTQPAMPMYAGRGQQDVQYGHPHHHPPYPPQQYPGQHQHHYRQPYYQQPPQQWAYYPNMPPMPPRGYPPHQYQPMMNPPYPMPQVPPSISPRPPQHMPPHHVSMRPHQAIYSPPPPERSVHPIPPSPSARPSPPAAPLSQPPRAPFYPPLPWYSVPESEFPAAPSRRRRRRKPPPQSPSLPVELPHNLRPTKPSAHIPEQHTAVETQTPPANSSPVSSTAPPNLDVARSETPATSQAPSENDSTQPTTPSSAIPPRPTIPQTKARSATKIVPVVPAVPNIPSLNRPSKRGSIASKSDSSKTIDADHETDGTVEDSAPTDDDLAKKEPEEFTETPKPSSPQVKAVPKSWADLVRSKAPASTTTVPSISNLEEIQPNGNHATKGASLSETLSKFTVRSSDSDGKIAFTKPRGLVNTGNMCYMNSIFQVLLFCVPFYDFLDRVGKNAAHSFKSETPMVDAMILFIREFSVIDAAASAEQLRMRLKGNELEEYGESFTPEFVYEVIRKLPRFDSMQRGHQQDAEEFLGFLLEELHEECVRAMKGLGPPSKDNTFPDEVSSASEASTPEDSGWLEVGPKQKASVTRSSGAVTAESPITKIFGGKLRSEFRVPGEKNSVTLEPYQPLQLDIGSPQISNIIDALKGLTRSEVLHGDFNSPRGPKANAIKQVFIETLPPVLILHLKRFQYDNTGGTQKIWKKVGYPLDLEIPKEVFPPHKRGGLAMHGGLPKYRLIGVVYHHGKSASGGHYTVDVRRQDGLEWIRFDDTVIRRVRSEDVAEGGSEEDPKVLAAALEQHKRDQSVSSNIFDQVREEQEESAQAEKGWSQVNGTGHSGTTTKKWSGVVNGTATPTTSSSGKHTPVAKYSVKDNKVAYILFYQKAGY